MRILLFLFGLAQAVSAPATPGSLIGTVTADGAPVRHARVVAQAPNGSAVATSTDGRGEFRFDRMTPGRYSVRVEKPGFVRPTALDAPLNQTLGTTQIQAGTVVTAPIQLARAGAITGTIDVSRRSPSDQSVIYVTVDRLFIDRNGRHTDRTFYWKGRQRQSFPHREPARGPLPRANVPARSLLLVCAGDSFR